MSSLISLLRFSIVLQVLIVIAWHFFQWFAWNDDMKLVLRGTVAEGKVAWLVVLMSAILAWWIYLSAQVWKLMRGAALMYFLFLIWMPLASTISRTAGGLLITGLDILYYMNGAFISCLTSFTPLRRYFRVIYEPGSYEFLKNPRKAQRLFKIGAVGFLFFGVLMQPDKPRSKARCCTKCCSQKGKGEQGESVEPREDSVEAVAAPAHEMNP